MNAVEEALHVSDIENLLVMPAGEVPPNPAELLGAHAFDQLLEQLDARADIIIVDTPPCLPVTDPIIVAAHMDAVALVLQLGATRKAGLKHTVDLLNHARARVVGVVFNQVQSHGTGYYYYHQYSPYYGNGNGNGHHGGNGRVQRNHWNGKAPQPDHDLDQVIAAHVREGDDAG
jgi:capsular exopolysaccharide synthesis family protein